MKQHITVEQFKELSKPARERLREYWSSKGEAWQQTWSMDHEEIIPLLSIGQMIEFLYDQRPDKRYKSIDLPIAFGNDENFPFPEEVCDSLWEAVKEVLSP